MSNYQINKIKYNNNTYQFQDNVSGYTTYNGNITQVQLNSQTIATVGKAQLLISQLSDIIYPVGCYYETSDTSFNPNVAWGGIWELEEEGMTHIGANASENTNLLNNPTADAGQSHTTYNVADFNLNTSLVAGQMYTVTAKVNTSHERKSVGFYHSGGTYIMPIPYNFSAFVPIQSNNIYSVVFIATTDMAAQTSGSGHGFIRVYSSNFENAIQGSEPITGTANVEWIKCESGCTLGALGGNAITKYKPAFTIPGYAITNNDIKTHTHTPAKQGNSFTRTFRQRYNGTGLTDASKLAAVGAFATGRTSSGNAGGSAISYLNANAVSQTGGYDVITVNFSHTHTSVGGGGTHTHTFTGTAASINVMQPYIVVNRWHKIGAAADSSFIMDTEISLSMNNAIFDGWIRKKTDDSGWVYLDYNILCDYIERNYNTYIFNIGDYGTLTINPNSGLGNDLITAIFDDYLPISKTYTSSNGYNIRINATKINNTVGLQFLRI